MNAADLHVRVLGDTTHAAQILHMARTHEMQIRHIRQPIADNTVHHGFTIEEVNHLKVPGTAPMGNSLGGPME